MLRFDFTSKHITDKSMKQVDSLDRRADWAKGVERNNKNQIILKKKWLEIKVVKKRQLLVEETEKKIIEKMKRSEVKNDEIVKGIKKMKKTRIKILRNNEWQIKNNLVLKERKMYILRDKELRLEII